LCVALAARPDGLFLVSDCMAFAGTDLTEITLGGRRILRRDGRLTLADGTLAGADLTLPRAVALLAGLGVPLAQVLAMATSTPARLIGAPAGRIAPGLPADMVHLTPDLALAQVWQGGHSLLPF
jgi:N-acetylglucosamine-6-phosphate deacetylase